MKKNSSVFLILFYTGNEKYPNRYRQLYFHKLDEIFAYFFLQCVYVWGNQPIWQYSSSKIETHIEVTKSLVKINHYEIKIMIIENISDFDNAKIIKSYYYGKFLEGFYSKIRTSIIQAYFNPGFGVHLYDNYLLSSSYTQKRLYVFNCVIF